MNDLLLHPETQAALTAFQHLPSHALILSGAPGSGKLTLATRVSETVLGLEPSGLSSYAYAKLISPAEGRSIGIETVRELEHFLSLRVPRQHIINRVVIIADSHLLTTEAQNALLKTIEEPPAGTIVLLTTASEQALLPTIRSRAQRIEVQRPLLSDMEGFFAAQGFATPAIKRALAMSGGLPGLTLALLSQTDHPLVVAAHKARELLGQSVFERLSQLDALAQNRMLCLDTLFIMQQMATISLPTVTSQAARRWKNILQVTYATQQSLRGGAQPKLALINLLLAI